MGDTTCMHEYIKPAYTLWFTRMSLKSDPSPSFRHPASCRTRPKQSYNFSYHQKPNTNGILHFKKDIFTMCRPIQRQYSCGHDGPFIGWQPCAHEIVLQRLRQFNLNVHVMVWFVLLSACRAMQSEVLYVDYEGMCRDCLLDSEGPE